MSGRSAGKKLYKSVHPPRPKVDPPARGRVTFDANPSLTRRVAISQVAISASLLGNKLFRQRDLVRPCPSASRQLDLLLTRSLRIV